MLNKIIFGLTLIASTFCYSQESLKLENTVPDFKLWFTDGTTITKNDIHNKVVVFKFWFTSCLPCLLDIDQLNGLVKEFSTRDDVLFLAPALDNKAIIKNFVEKNKFDFKIAYSSIEASQVFNPTQVYPSYFIINKKGEFTYIDSGSKQSHFQDLKIALLKTLKE